MLTKIKGLSSISKVLNENLDSCFSATVRFSFSEPKHKTIYDGALDHEPPCFNNKNVFRQSSHLFRFTNPKIGGIFSRSAHTDLEFPKFEDIRINNPGEGPKQYENQKSIYVGSLMAGMGAFAMAKSTFIGALDNMAPDETQMFGSVLETSIAHIAEGTTQTIRWNKKPLFVRHLTDADIEESKKVVVSSLIDPETYEQRTPVNPKYVVMIGICTHLGCVPVINAGDYNAFWCNCHGSHFDILGRIRYGPATKNLEIPNYKLSSDLILTAE